MSDDNRFTTRVAVFIILKNEDGEIILQKRKNTGYMDGSWDFVASGHVDPNESIRRAAVRELFEEAGVKAQEQDLRLVHINQNDLHLDTPYINFTFMLEKWEGEPRICEEDKCSEMKSFQPDDLPESCVLSVKVNELDGFSDELSYSYVNDANYESIMGEPLRVN